MSRWAKLDVPSLKLASQLDTDHWAKLKGKVISIKYQNTFFPFFLEVYSCFSTFPSVLFYHDFMVIFFVKELFG